MRTRITPGRVCVWAGVASVLVLAGCGPDPAKVAKTPPPADPPVVTTPPDPPTTPPTTTAAAPPTGPGTGVPILPGGIIVNPLGGVSTPPPTAQGGTFVPPTSSTFTPPESLPGPGAQLPGTPPMPVAQAPMPAVQPPPATPPDPPKPGDPPATTTPPPTEPTKPTKVEYPASLGGKDLAGWLAELKYTSAGPVQKDDQVRETAVKTIPSFGPDARKPAVKPLIEAIASDPDPGVQIAAITVVSNMGFEMREEVRPVLIVLQQRLATSVSGNIVRMYCVRSLASFGPDAVGAVQRLRDVCGDPSWETRREVAIALSMIGAAPVDERGKPKKNKDGVEIGPNRLAIDTLMDFQLKDRCVTVRLDAAKSLLALGPPVPKTPADFAELTKEIQKTIAEAVKFESGKGAATNKYGGRPDRGVYVWDLVLQIMYDDTKTATNLKELARLVAEPDGPTADQVRLYALQAIGACGSLVGKQEPAVSEKVVGAVTDALRYSEPVLVYTAMTTLALLGRDSAAAVPALKKIADQEPKPPADAPKGTPPDDTLQRAARQTIEVITGKRKMEDFGKEDPKPMDKQPMDPKVVAPMPMDKK